MKKLLFILIIIFGVEIGWGQATLPLSTDALSVSSLPSEFSHSGLGSNYTSPCSTALKFDDVNDRLVLFFNGQPGVLTYQLRGFVGSGSWNGTLTVEQSANGTTYSNLETITGSGTIPTTGTYIKTNNPASTTRYIRWTYTTKTNGNIGICNIDLTAGAATTPILAITGTANNGSSCENTAATSQTYTITNSGTVATGVAVALSGTNAADVAITTAPATSLGATGTATSTTTFTVTFTPSAAGARSATLTSSYSSGTNSGTLAISGTGVSPPPEPTTTNPAAVCEGTIATATGAGSGAGATYSFYTVATGGSPISNTANFTVTTTAMSSTAATPADTYNFFVQGNNNGCASATRKQITFVINPAGTAPTGAITGTTPACGSTTLTHTAATVNTYWQTTATGISTASPTTTPLNVSLASTYYVRGYNGTCWSTNNLSYAVVINTAINITTPPPNRSILAGANTTFNVVATGTTPSYQWQVNTGSGFADIPVGAPYSNITTNTLGIANATISMNGYLYHCVVSGATPCASVTSSGGTLTVNLPPVPVVTAATLSANVNVAFSYNVIASNSPTLYAIVSGTLPNGIVFNTTTGVFSGTPTAIGSTVLGITATNAGGTSVAQNITIDVILGPCLDEDFAAGTLPSGMISTSVNFAGNTANFNVASGILTTFAVSNPQSLTFTLERSNNTNAKSLFVSVSTSVNGIYTDLFEYTIANTTIGIGTPVSKTIDLSAYSTQPTIFIRFRKVSSTASPWLVDNIVVNCSAPCTAPTISSVSPNSGSENTEVTIIASSGTLLNATATFGGVAAIPVSSSTTQLVVKIPSGAITSTLLIKDALFCDVTVPYTIINSNRASCEGKPDDLIFYEIHDEQFASGGTVTIFNGTTTTKDLTNYRIFRTNTQNDGAEVNYASLTGTIAPNSLGIIAVSGSDCAPNQTNGVISGGFNENDGFQIRRSDGTTIIDDVDTYVPTAGYYMKRKIGAFLPRTSFNSSDWTTTTLLSNECANGLGSNPTDFLGYLPTITTQPSLSLTCSATTATISVIAAQGIVDATPLVYQWYVAAPGGNFAEVPNAAPYQLGSCTSASLVINSISGLNDYQYYCQVRENTTTCFKATVAVKLVAGAVTEWVTGAWTNGVPSLNALAIISSNYDMTLASRPSIEVCSLQINSPAVVTVDANKYIKIENNLTVDAGATLNILNNGSLVQINDVGTVSGSIKMQRTANVRLQDYVYWSSPLADSTFPVTSVSSPTTNFIYKWQPTGFTTNGATSPIGNWVATSEDMKLGQGYIVRGPTGTSASVAAPMTANFVGTPNNGLYNVGIARGTYTLADYNGTNNTPITKNDDNWNLIGNPYPSAIDAKKFLQDNNKIEGKILIWKHGILPSAGAAQPFYNTYGSNYSATDYVEYNATGASIQNGYNGNIGAGQGFFVLMNDDFSTAENVIFKNSQRLETDNSVVDNSQFYRTANAAQNVPTEGRYWMYLKATNNNVNSMMIGYVDGATNADDHLFDASNNNKESQNLYSLIGNDKKIIQGRGIPFVTSDIVPVGFKSPAVGTYRIGISGAHGLFAIGGQTIYLEDKLLNIVHNITLGEYQFTANQGTFNDRFVLRYTNLSLSNTVFENANNVFVFKANEAMAINSKSKQISSVIVYDVLGRVLFENKNVNAMDVSISTIAPQNQAVLVKIALENGEILVKKMIF